MLKKWGIRGSDTLNQNHPTTSGCHLHVHVNQDGQLDYEMTRSGKRKPWTKSDDNDGYTYLAQRLVGMRWNETLGKDQPVEMPGYGGSVTFHFHPDYFKRTVIQ